MSQLNLKLYSVLELKKIRDNFLKELILASQGKKTSLAAIINPLPQKSVVKEGEIFQVMVIGGAVFEKALIKIPNFKFQIPNKFQSPKFKIQNYKKSLLPLFKTKEIFLKFFEKQLDSKTKVVALNFAFGLKPLLRKNLLDGQLIVSSKEHAFAGLINKIIGEELEKYIFQKQKRRIKVTAANDTICLLLSGINDYSRQPTNFGRSAQFGMVAGIVGTGTNFAFFLDKQTAINLESGNFDKFPPTETGKIIDKNSTHPGNFLFEKEVAGAYLYQHYNHILGTNSLRSYKDGSLILNSTEQLTAIARKNQPSFSQIAQKPARHRYAQALAGELFERSASLIACQMAGIFLYLMMENRSWKIEFEDRGSKLDNNLASILNRLPSKSLTLIMEGSLFWRGWQYKKIVEDYLEKLGVEKDKINFVKINQSGILGAAHLIACQKRK